MGIFIAQFRNTQSRLKGYVGIIIRLLQELNSEGFNVQFQWRLSHVGVEGNEIADQMLRKLPTFAPTVRFPTITGTTSGE